MRVNGVSRKRGGTSRKVASGSGNVNGGEVKKTTQEVVNPIGKEL